MLASISAVCGTRAWDPHCRVPIHKGVEDSEKSCSSQGYKCVSFLLSCFLSSQWEPLSLWTFWETESGSRDHKVVDSHIPSSSYHTGRQLPRSPGSWQSRAPCPPALHTTSGSHLLPTLSSSSINQVVTYLHPRPTVERPSGGMWRVVLTLHATREASPVGKDDEGQVLVVEIPDGLCCLVGGVWEPYLARLLDDLGHRVTSVRQ